MMGDRVCAIQSRISMKPCIWLSFSGIPWVEFAVDVNGTLDVSRIAARTRLRPDSLTVGEVGIYEGITIQDIRFILGSTAGEGRDIALRVDGDAGHDATGFEDRSEIWIKHMMLPQLPALPRNVDDLRNILLPKQHGRLPMNSDGYRKFRSDMRLLTEKFLIEADGSVLPTHLTGIMFLSLGPSWSEMDVSMFIGSTFKLIFGLFDKYGQDKFVYTLAFNRSEKSGDSISGTTKERSRPDTILTAAGCTFLVGEDKFSSLTTAEEDLRSKIMILSPMFYGNVECILGYVAAGTVFQWVFIGKDGQVRKAGPSLNLATESSRCEFLLSIGYAYQLIRKMVDSVPDVPGRRAMFTQEIVGDREIAFYPEYVTKRIKNFGSFCNARMTRIDLILKAYRVGESCRSLPRIRKVGGEYVEHDTYRVQISPIGFTPMLDRVEDTRMFAKNVCEALSVLHQAGLVHRDIRPPNILQVSMEQFMLIDLETVAESPFRVPPGFQFFKDWTDDMLEGNCYTPMSDMYQLGQILENQNTTSSESAQQFIGKLRAKQYTAELALGDPWLS